MNIAVIGSGYVGLVAGACFAENGNDVICADIDESKISALKMGEIPIFEPGLDDLIEYNVEAGRLCFTSDVPHAIRSSEVIFIAVGTPEDSDGSADLKYVLAVAETIGKNMNAKKYVVDKSTVPVGTTELVRNEIARHTDVAFEVISNPEFLKEGSAIDDFLKPDRVIIGTSSVDAAEVMRELYSPFLRTGKPILIMDEKSAEVTKYAANAMLATKVSFMNEMSLLCEVVGADISQVQRGIGTDNRIGPSFLFPGVGYGGSCFPKDVRALTKTAACSGLELEIVKAVDKVNERQKSVLANKIVKAFGEDLSQHIFAIWGLAFKPKTDDMREAPSLTIIRELIKRKAKIRAYDPEAIENTKRMFHREGILEKKHIEYFDNSYEALNGASALVIITEWNEFRRPNFTKIQQALKAPIIFDGRNIYDLDAMKRSKFTYHSIGRPTVVAEQKA